MLIFGGTEMRWRKINLRIGSGLVKTEIYFCKRPREQFVPLGWPKVSNFSRVAVWVVFQACFLEMGVQLDCLVSFDGPRWSWNPVGWRGKSCFWKSWV